MKKKYIKLDNASIMLLLISIAAVLIMIITIDIIRIMLVMFILSGFILFIHFAFENLNKQKKLRK